MCATRAKKAQHGLFEAEIAIVAPERVPSLDQIEDIDFHEVSDTEGPSAVAITEHALRLASGDMSSVRHPVELAAIVPITMRMTLHSRKAWMFLVSYALNSEAQQTDEGLEWRVPLAKLMKDIGFDSNNTAYLKARLKECEGTTVEWGNSARNPETGVVTPSDKT